MEKYAIMGTLTDLISLVSQLLERTKDRKAAQDLLKIQVMIATFQSEQAKLNEDNINLRSEKAELKAKIAELERELIQARSPQLHQDEDLDEITTKILIFIANTPGNVSRDMVIKHFNLSKAIVDSYFDQLKDRKYIKSIGGESSVGQNWEATKEGREHLVSKGLFE